MVTNSTMSFLTETLGVQAHWSRALNEVCQQKKQWKLGEGTGQEIVSVPFEKENSFLLHWEQQNVWWPNSALF